MKKAVSGNLFLNSSEIWSNDTIFLIVTCYLLLCITLGRTFGLCYRGKIPYGCKKCRCQKLSLLSHKISSVRRICNPQYEDAPLVL